MRKIIGFLHLISFSAILFGMFSVSAKEDSPTIVDFGYNKFVISPYSGTMAVTTFDSHRGIEIFQKSKHTKAFFKLAPHYSPQQHINSCGIASAVIILNTVYANAGVTPPISIKGSWYVPEENTVYGQFVWTENNFYNHNVDHIVNKEVLEGRKKIDGNYHPGIEIDRLARALRAQGLIARAYHVNSAGKEDIDVFRKLVKRITANPRQYMMVNYDLDLYAAQGGGHISPVASYEKGSDSVLILDTWSASNSWIWVKLVDLFQAMHTKDGQVYRGYILVDQFIENG